MPSIVKIRIDSGRNLPVMDRSTGSTDAFVEIKFAGREEQTDIARKTLHPKWEHGELLFLVCRLLRPRGLAW